MRIAQRAGRVLARRSRRAAEGGGQEGRGADQEGAGQVRRASRGAGPSDGGWSTSWPRRSRPSAATASTSRTRWRTRSCRYQTAWLKAHYPAEFMAALLSSEIGNTDKVVQYINEARELELEMLPPDVNESGFKFTVVGERPDPLRAGRGAQRGRGRHRLDHRRRGRTAPFTRRWPTWWSGSTSGSATSGCSSRWSRPAPATRWAATASSCRGAGAGVWPRRSCCSRSGRPGQASLFGEAGRRDADGTRQPRSACPTSRPGPRPSGWPRRRRCSASSSRAIRWSGSATRSSCSAPAPPPRWASGASTR